MAPRDPSTIRRDGSGQFASTNSSGGSAAASLAAGLAQIQAQRSRKKKVTAREKAVLKTLASGEDKLGEYFDNTQEILVVVEALEAQGLIVNDGTGYALTEAGIQAVTPKRRKRRRS